MFELNIDAVTAENANLSCLRAPDGSCYNCDLNFSREIVSHLNNNYPSLFAAIIKTTMQYPHGMLIWFMTCVLGYDHIINKDGMKIINTTDDYEQKQKEFPGYDIKTAPPYIWNKDTAKFEEYDRDGIGYTDLGDLLPQGTEITFESNTEKKTGFIAAYCLEGGNLKYYVTTKNGEDYFISSSEIKRIIKCRKRSPICTQCC